MSRFLLEAVGVREIFNEATEEKALTVALVKWHNLDIGPEIRVWELGEPTVYETPTLQQSAVEMERAACAKIVDDAWHLVDGNLVQTRTLPEIATDIKMRRYP